MINLLVHASPRAHRFYHAIFRVDVLRSPAMESREHRILALRWEFARTMQAAAFYERFAASCPFDVSGIREVVKWNRQPLCSYE
jgi:hypothetical protein